MEEVFSMLSKLPEALNALEPLATKKGYAGLFGISFFVFSCLLTMVSFCVETTMLSVLV